MSRVIGDEIQLKPWGDASLHGISWCSEGRDLTLKWVLANRDQVNLVCTWASSLNISIQCGNNEANVPFTWGAEFVKVETGGWNVLFDFAGQGVVELSCSEMFIENW